MGAQRRYQEFHGHGPRYAERVNLHQIPSTIVRLGSAVAIEYECDKLNGGGDGKMAVYRHEFETPCELAMSHDSRGKVQLYIFGRGLRVTDAGIEG